MRAAYRIGSTSSGGESGLNLFINDVKKIQVVEPPPLPQTLLSHDGGEGGIRTPDRLAPMPHFECGAFDHSATSPGAITDDILSFGQGPF